MEGKRIRMRVYVYNVYCRFPGQNTTGIGEPYIECLEESSGKMIRVVVLSGGLFKIDYFDSILDANPINAVPEPGEENNRVISPMEKVAEKVKECFCGTNEELLFITKPPFEGVLKTPGQVRLFKELSPEQKDKLFTSI